MINQSLWGAAFDLLAAQSHTDFEMPFGWIGWAVVAVVLVGLIAFGTFYAPEGEDRPTSLRKMAAQFRMEFDPGLKNRNPDFEPFKQGGRRRVENTLVGMLHGRVVQTGDFYFETYETDKNEKTRTIENRFSYCWAKTPEVLFVDLAIRREGLFDKMKSAVGTEDINFESAEFSRKFYVTSLDRKFAYDVICPQMMEYLLKRPEYEVYLNYSGLLILDGRSTWRTEEFPEAMNFAGAFLERIPAHVWDKYKSNQAL